MEEKKQLTSREYKSVLLETLNEFDRFCRKNQIKYFLVYGTLLGAIRHKGFIPWDDDIDIALSPEDYEKFKKLYENNEKYYFIDCFTNKKYYLTHGKFCSNRVDIHENVNTKLHLGANIDVFKFCFINNEKYDQLKRFMRNDTFSKKIISLKYANYKGKSVLTKIAIFISRLVCPFSLNHITRKKIKKSMKFVSDEPTSLIGNLFDSDGISGISDYQNFKDVIEVEFEGRKYYAPVGYDSYLRGLFNNYMELPPVEKRVTHHSFVAYWR